jgi:hypothetical protein
MPVFHSLLSISCCLQREEWVGRADGERGKLFLFACSKGQWKKVQLTEKFLAKCGFTWWFVDAVVPSLVTSYFPRLNWTLHCTLYTDSKMPRKRSRRFSSQHFQHQVSETPPSVTSMEKYALRTTARTYPCESCNVRLKEEGHSS